MWDGIYNRTPNNPILIYDDSYWDRSMKWLEDWKEKCDEPELLEVVCGTKSTRRNTFI